MIYFRLRQNPDERDSTGYRDHRDHLVGEVATSRVDSHAICCQRSSRRAYTVRMKMLISNGVGCTRESVTRTAYSPLITALSPRTRTCRFPGCHEMTPTPLPPLPSPSCHPVTPQTLHNNSFLLPNT